jgi:glucose-1-phosphate thymidylyltransferase
MTENLKIVVPMAGFGKRMRPHTWSRPKPLVSAAGKPILEHVLDGLKTAPNADQAEMIFIVGYLGEKVENYMATEHPEIKAHFVEQKEMLGQSHAIAEAREYLHGPTLIVFVDTVIDADFSFLKDEDADAVIWVKEVEDPRRFGVVEVGENGLVKGLIEKPDSKDNNLAIVGIYYFKDGKQLLDAIDEQIENKVQTKNEYFLADAIDLMLKKDMKLRPKNVGLWLDAGLPETVLESNRTLLKKGQDNSETITEREGVIILPPVNIHPKAQISNSRIGPNVSVAADCQISNSQIEESVLERGAQVIDSRIQDSILGERSRVQGFSGSLNVGDDSQISTNQS